jgi:hypothetical protein
MEQLRIFDLGPDPAHVAERQTTACFYGTLHPSGNVPQLNIGFILKRQSSFECSIQISASQGYLTIILVPSETIALHSPTWTHEAVTTVEGRRCMSRTTMAQRLLPDIEAFVKSSKPSPDQMDWKVSQHTEVSHLDAARFHYEGTSSYPLEGLCRAKDTASQGWRESLPLKCARFGHNDVCLLSQYSNRKCLF